MSAMEKMLTEMLMSIVPPEVMQMLTAENINKGIARVNEYLSDQKAFQEEVIERLRILEDGGRNCSNGRDTERREIGYDSGSGGDCSGSSGQQ